MSDLTAVRNAWTSLPGEIDADFVRASFPGMADITFLDHAAASPLPRPSIDAMILTAEGLGSSDSPNALDIADQLRIEIGELINADHTGVALTRSTAHGITILSNGLDFVPGDNVVVVEGDYPSARYPWMARRDDGLEVRLVRPGEGPVTPELVLDMTDSRTRVVCLAEVMFISGYRVDIATIGAECRRRGILFCVDGMQSIGAFELDVVASNIDFLASGTVKWLMGPNGISFCWMRSDLLDELPPLIPGALTVQNRMDFTAIEPVWATDAHRFEETWLPPPEMAALSTSIRIANEVGSSTIAQGVRTNCSALVDGLLDMGVDLYGSWPRTDAETSGIVSFSHPSVSAEQIGNELRQASVRFSPRANTVRLSPHYYNTREDLQRALNAVDRAIHSATRDTLPPKS